MEQNNSRVAVHTYADRAEADAVIRNLQAAGFSNDQISVVARDRGEQRDIADEHHIGAGTGASIGVVEGAIIGLLAGIGGLLVPGIGAVAAVGPIAGLITGGITGGIAGALAGWGLDAAEAKGYEERVGAGDVLVAVRDDDPARVGEARRIMDGGYDTTATDYATTSGTSLGAANTSAAMGSVTEDVTDRDEVRVPVMEEELVAGKRQTEQGRVRLHKDVIEEQKTIDVPVTREEVHVERVPVSGTYDANTTDAFQEKDIDVPVMGEEVIAEKRAHVAEEVRLRKDTITDNQQVSDTVRRERVVVDGDAVDEPTTSDRRGI